ncbi:hypothetical protein [Nocardioides sp. B-3]|uniref:hypothetical protein n=1 Tax=Nocardioides sp. B-3 TaxID=2895565 RepID=UPI002153150E|nr:hypothetical protein [Nocardioides sp. B-3]UUZ57726.1 hypothetical protein LP418_14950 [Nocardioides sp. B-3]
MTDAVRDMAVSAALRGIALGPVPLATRWLLGPHRRGQLFRGVRTRKGVLGAVLLLSVPLLLWQPRSADEDTQEAQGEWEPLETFMAGYPVPVEAAGIEIRNSPTTVQTQRLIQSAVDTYEQSKDFYDRAAAEAESLDVREPEDDETVALLVSDRHDNIGMDRVARAVGDRAGATVVLDGGDDTSTGQPPGGVQPRLPRPRVRRPRPLRGGGQPRPRAVRHGLSQGPRVDDARRDARRGAVGWVAARGRRPALERARQLA